MKWRGLHRDHPLHVPYKWARRIVITITGFTVLAVGVAMRRISSAGEAVEESAVQRELESLQARFEALISHAS